MGLDKQTIREVMQRVTQIPVERWQLVLGPSSDGHSFRALTPAGSTVELKWDRLEGFSYPGGGGYHHDSSGGWCEGYNYLKLEIDGETVLIQEGMWPGGRLLALVWGSSEGSCLQRFAEELGRQLDVRHALPLLRREKRERQLAAKKEEERQEEEKRRAQEQAERRRLLDKF